MGASRGSDERTANLLGALALTLADGAGAAVHAGAGVSGSDATASLVICRMCDPDVCGHPERCPVTQAARAAA